MWSDDVDVEQHQRRMLGRPERRILLSKRPNSLLIIRRMGSHWSCPTLLRREDLFRITTLLLDWRPNSNHHVVVLEDLEEGILEEVLAQRQLAAHLRWDLQCPSGYRHQLLLLGVGQLHLQPSHL